MDEIKIVKKHIDSRNRIVLPLKTENDSIFVLTLGGIVILGKSEKELKEFSKTLEQIEKEKKIKAIESWFDLIEEAGLSNFTKDKIRDKHLSIIKKRIGEI